MDALNQLEAGGEETDLLRNLVAVSHNMGFTQMQVKELRRKEKCLIMAEEHLDDLHSKIKD